ncbi:hypothetical protein BC828DRAFT_238857 [Blastocladiella britannica]|nr:hypothetical protein BC828DRAFT_238857 [Blastocladiella britannica]
MSLLHPLLSYSAKNRTVAAPAYMNRAKSMASVARNSSAGLAMVFSILAGDKRAISAAAERLAPTLTMETPSGTALVPAWRLAIPATLVFWTPATKDLATLWAKLGAIAHEQSAGADRDEDVDVYQALWLTTLRGELATAFAIALEIDPWLAAMLAFAANAVGDPSDAFGPAVVCRATEFVAAYWASADWVPVASTPSSVRLFTAGRSNTLAPPTAAALLAHRARSLAADLLEAMPESPSTSRLAAVLRVTSAFDPALDADESLRLAAWNAAPAADLQAAAVHAAGVRAETRGDLAQATAWYDWAGDAESVSRVAATALRAAAESGNVESLAPLVSLELSTDRTMDDNVMIGDGEHQHRQRDPLAVVRAYYAYRAYHSRRGHFSHAAAAHLINVLDSTALPLTLLPELAIEALQFLKAGHAVFTFRQLHVILDLVHAFKSSPALPDEMASLGKSYQDQLAPLEMVTAACLRAFEQGSFVDRMGIS